MTPEEYWAYKAFIRDDATERALSGSEVFMNYRKAEMTRESEMKRIAEEKAKADEEAVLQEFLEFEKKVQASPELRARLKQARDFLAENPEAIEQVDPNFINGLKMLDLDEEL